MNLYLVKFYAHEVIVQAESYSDAENTVQHPENIDSITKLNTNIECLVDNLKDL